MLCPASFARSQGEPEQSSVYALEGTAAHEFCEHVMVTRTLPRDYLGGVVWLTANTEPVRIADIVNPDPDGHDIWRIDHAMVLGAELYRDTILEICGGYFDPDVWIVMFERRVLATHVDERIYGTVDCLLFNRKTRTLYVIDFKYGQGIAVEVDWNTQLLIYGIGAAALFAYDIETLELVVVQPRADHPKGPVRRHPMHVLDLIEFEHDLFLAAREVDSPTARVEVGEHCRFCPALYRCKEARAHVLMTLGANVKSLYRELRESDLPDVENMDPEDLGKAFREIAIIKAYVRRVEERAHSAALEGRPPPDLKLVEGRSDRKWVDELSAEQALRRLGVKDDSLYAPRKFLSPAQAEAAIGKKKFREQMRDLWVKPRGSLVLVPKSDPRDEVKPSAGEAFGAVEGEDGCL